MHRLTIYWERQSAGKKHGSGLFVAGTILVIAHQRVSAGGELHTDLMASAGIKPYSYQTIFATGQAGIAKPCLFDTLSLFLDNKNLFFAAVLKQ